MLLLCAPAAAMPPGAQAVIDKAGVKLDDADLYRIAEIYNFWEQKGARLWPGMHIATTPVQIVFPEKLDILIGGAKPPADCEKVDEELPGFGRTYCHRKDRKFLYGGATGREGGDIVVSANTLEVFDDYVNKLVQQRQPGAARLEKPYLQYLGEIAHELTHAHQYSEARKLPKKELRGTVKSTKIDYPYQDEETCLLLGLEGRLLADIMDEADSARLKELWLDFLAVRRARRARLPGDLPAAERVMELREGTAQYVGWSVQYGRNSDVQPLPQLAADPRFSGYASSDTLRDMLRQSLLTLHLPAQSRWMLYVYTTGTALAYNLEKAVPGWKEGFFRRVGGLRSGLDDLVTRGMPRSGRDADRIAAARARYGAPALSEEIRKHMAEALADSKAKLDKFHAAPGRRVRFSLRGAGPEDITAMGPVLLTEHGQRRVWEAGLNKVAVRLGEKNERAVIFEKAVPVLQYRDAALFEVVLPEGSAPEIRAEKTAVKGGRTVYKGGVEYRNGVFSWKGDRLETSEKDGVVTLLF